jgi:hypothetical protein
VSDIGGAGPRDAPSAGRLDRATGAHTRGAGIRTQSLPAEKLALGVALSLLLHALLAVLAVTLLPALARRLASPVDLEPPAVLHFSFDTPTADVDPSSRVETPPATPLQGQFASRARDRVRDDRDTPIPSGAAPVGENTLPGDASMQPVEAAGASPPPPTDAEVRARDPDAGRQAMLDGLQSETAMLTGRRQERPARSSGGGPGARTLADASPDGALEFGDFAFSTYAWSFEPYWEYMRRRLYANWHPPAAYRDYGIIQGGWTLVRATLDRQGRLVGCRIVGEDGHASLHPASFAAMQGAAPFRPLPGDFPDDSLVVTVKFIYLKPGIARSGPMP